MYIIGLNGKMVFISMIYKFQLLVFVFRPVDFKVISWNGFFFV